MTKQELIDGYTALESRDKVQFLATCSHYLTVILRGDYDSNDLEYRVQRLMGANELQHHLSSELGHHNDGTTERYPDEVLINIVLEKAVVYNIAGELNLALNHAARVFAEAPRII